MMEEDGSGVVVDGDRTLDDPMNSDDYSPAAVGEDLETSPVARNRSNTWHGPPKVTPKDDATAGDAGPDVDFGPEGGADGLGPLGNAGSAGAWRKGTSRRNAWGNLSYADLITKAIESSLDKRMTLSQIYGWMVQNISFFKDKGESNSSAGWKNSIRHNLSLHNRFMRVQNEGAGKSSWWMINPDAKAVKIPRRRAATMDTKTYTGKRSRVQRAASVNSTAIPDDLPSKNDERDSLEMNKANADYQRGSTSSGISLSHMQPVTEVEDAGETEMIPLSSSWTGNFSSGENFAETLSESLADIFVGNLIKDDELTPKFQSRINVPLSAALHSNSLTQPTFVTRKCPIMHPVVSPRGTSGDNFDGMAGGAGALCNNLQMFGPSSFSPGMKSPIGLGKSPDTNCRFSDPFGSATQSAVDGALQVPSCNIYANKSNELLQTELTTTTDKAIKPSSPNQFASALGINQVQSVNVAPNSRPLNSQFLLQLLASKPQLMAKMQHLIQTRQQQQQQCEQSSVPTHAVQSNPVIANRSGSMLQQLLISSSDAARSDPLHLPQVPSLPVDVPTLANSSNSTFIPADLDLNFLDFDAADIDCDIDQVIKHELTFGENLDFAFDRSTDV